ncbi:MAG: T9SS type A sorting domain-containing protein [Flavobacteriales bacterium]|nr:T9SS type A sorting domain-containing protein [Flavobacteriales bacterium]
MGVEQALAQGTLRIGYPERIYEFASAVKFEEYLQNNGVYEFSATNTPYFILEESLPDRRTNEYVTFPIRVEIRNAPSTPLFASPQVETITPQLHIVSRFGSVTQSSTNTTIVYEAEPIDAGAWKAIDGNNNGRINVQLYQQGLVPVGSFSQTNVENEPWLDLDLGGEKIIDYVDVWSYVNINGNQMETLDSEFTNFYVLVSKLPFGSVDLATARTMADYEYYKDGTLQRKMSMNNLAIRGRYIRIQGVGNRMLRMAEIEVVGKVCFLSTFTDVQSACETYTWIDGNTYTSSNNTATHVLINASGCDSLVTLDLTVLSPSTNTDVQTACETYTWIDGNTYTSSNNTATHLLMNASGCDSVITLDLTINLVDASVVVNGATITANAIGVSYQWLNCDNNYDVITGETNQSFTASVNGNYALQVMSNGCADTSVCVNITDVHLMESPSMPELSVFPSPNNGQFYATLLNGELFQVTILDLQGQIIFRSREMNNKHELNLSLSSGVYLVEARTLSGHVSQKRLIIQQ